jgi:hypothetical protein
MLRKSSKKPIITKGIPTTNPTIVRLTIKPVMIKTNPRIAPTSRPVNSRMNTTRRQTAHKGHKSNGTRHSLFVIFSSTPIYAANQLQLHLVFLYNHRLHKNYHHAMEQDQQHRRWYPCQQVTPIMIIEYLERPFLKRSEITSKKNPPYPPIITATNPAGETAPASYETGAWPRFASPDRTAASAHFQY